MILSLYHRPVLLPEVLDLLKINKGAIYIDATIGFGGYALEIIKHQGIVLGFDKDQFAIEYLRKKRISNLFLFNENFADIKLVLENRSFGAVSGIIFDLGLSSYQLDQSKRGFSFLKEEPLDMRFNVRQKLTAEKIINTYSEEELYEIFTKNAEELNSRPIAHSIVRARTLTGPIKTTVDLNGIIKKNLNKEQKEFYGTLARIYQAVRIETNNELNNIKKGISEGISILARGGTIIVISYQSLEDRLVKEKFRRQVSLGNLKLLTAKPIFADYKEISRNPRSKSAKLRAAEKL